MTNDNIGFYRKAELRPITGLSDSTRDRLEKLGLFPKRKQLSPRNVGWSKASIIEWVNSREEINP